MRNVLIVDEEDMEFICNTLQDQQIIFHPSIAPNGKIDYRKFFATKRTKRFTIFLDRNILISLLKFCEKGSLKNKAESQIIGLLMAWADLNTIPISAGLAVRERAAHLHSEEYGLIELQKFLDIFDFYPSQMWLGVAEGKITEIPPINFSLTPASNITVDYSDGGDHYDMAVASLLHAVQLYRDKTMKPVDKIIAFFDWMCEYLLISEYLLVYVVMLFTDQENIKAPKNSNSDDFEKVFAGCENQAWDITYLTNWSTLYSDAEKCDTEYLFATNDILLKRIFINMHAPHGLNRVLYCSLSQKDYDKVCNHIQEKMSVRIKPDFGDDPQAYFQKIISMEKEALALLLDKK